MRSYRQIDENGDNNDCQFEVRVDLQLGVLVENVED